MPCQEGHNKEFHCKLLHAVKVSSSSARERDWDGMEHEWVSGDELGGFMTPYEK